MENTENQNAKGDKDKKNTSGEAPFSQDNGENIEETQQNKGAEGDEGQEAEAAADQVQSSAQDEGFREKYYYLAAEMENMKRRVQKEKEGLLKYGNEKILQDLIEVIDNFERTIIALRQDEDKKIQNIVVGIDMINKQLFTVLQKYGLTPVEALGKEFDPNFHEAVAQKNVEGKKEDEIVEEYQKGYTLNGRLLRPAKVVVCQE